MTFFCFFTRLSYISSHAKFANWIKTTVIFSTATSHSNIFPLLLFLQINASRLCYAAKGTCMSFNTKSLLELILHPWPQDPDCPYFCHIFKTAAGRARHTAIGALSPDGSKLLIPRLDLRCWRQRTWERKVSRSMISISGQILSFPLLPAKRLFFYSLLGGTWFYPASFYIFTFPVEQFVSLPKKVIFK